MCLSLHCFQEQMAALAEHGLHGVTLEEGLRSWRENSVVLTFDDGYEDLAQVVAPELASRGWTATVFLASQCTERRGLDHLPTARLLSWSQAGDLVKAGWEVGSHSLSHRDLSRLPQKELVREIRDSRGQLEERLQSPVRSFAAPYGRVNRRVRETVARHYLRAVGTRLAEAGPDEDVYDLPRLEMWYFRNPERWRQQLAGQGQRYLRWRRMARWLGQIWRGEQPWRDWG